MKKVLLFLFLASTVFAMENGESKETAYDECYKSQYEMEYERASMLNQQSSPLASMILLQRCERVIKRKLAEEVLQPRLDDIDDVMAGRPNKFKKQDNNT